MKRPSFNVKDISLILGILGFTSLGMIKFVSSKYSSRSSNEIKALKTFISMAEKTLSKEKACLNTFSSVQISKKSRSLASIKSENNFNELTVGSMVTNNILFYDMSVQLVDRHQQDATVLHKIFFKNTRTGKLIRSFRFFHTKLKPGPKLTECKIGRSYHF